MRAEFLLGKRCVAWSDNTWPQIARKQMKTMPQVGTFKCGRSVIVNKMSCNQPGLIYYTAPKGATALAVSPESMGDRYLIVSNSPELVDSNFPQLLYSRAVPLSGGAHQVVASAAKAKVGVPKIPFALNSGGGNQSDTFNAVVPMVPDPKYF